MGFGGGGGGAITPHVHNSVPLQGGPLDFANDTIASLNVGSTTFSNGAALQELAIGNPSDTLVVNGLGTAPEWGAPGGGAWNLDGSDSSTNTAALNVTGMVGRDITICYFQVEPATAVTMEYPILRINGVSSATYDTVNYRVYGGAAGTTTVDRTGTGYILEEDSGNNSELVYSGEMIIWKGNPNLGFTGNTMKNMTGTYRNDIGLTANTVMGTGAQPDTNPITDISVRLTSGNISGKIQVISMNYS